MLMPLKKIHIILFIFASSVFTQLIASDSSSEEEEELKQTVFSNDRWSKIPEEIKSKPLALGYLAFRGSTSIVSEVIQTFSKSKWSHIAMILCDPNNRSNKESWYCFESSLYPGKPIYDLKSYNVHIVEWEKSLFTQNVTNAAVRAFNFDKKEPKSNEIKDVINVYLDRPYEHKLSEIFLSILKSNTSKDLSSIFCSELIAITLQDLKLLSENELSNNYFPSDFSKENRHLKLINGVTLGDEIALPNVPSKKSWFCCIY